MRAIWFCLRRLLMSPREITVFILTLTTGISMLITYQVSRNIPIQSELKVYMHHVKVDGIYEEGKTSQGYDKFPTPRAGDSEGNGNVISSLPIMGTVSVSVSVSHNVSDATNSDKTSQRTLKQKLQQIEATMLQISNMKHKVALLVSDSEFQVKLLPTYSSLLEKQGYKVYKAKNIPNDQTWNSLFCFKNNNDCDEQYLAYIAKGSFIKINRILPLTRSLVPKDELCHTLNRVRNVPVIKRNNMVPTCFVLPSQYEEFLLTAASQGDNSKWVVQDLDKDNNSHPKLVQPGSISDFAKVKQFQSKNAIVQQYFQNQLMLFGMPFSIHVVVLVTSLTPLRAYIHSSSIVQYRNDYQRDFQKVLNRVWKLQQFQQYLIHHYSKDASDVAFRNIESIIVQTLMASQYQIFNHLRCNSCYQLLGFEVLLNKSFHPLITKVTDTPLDDWQDSINTAQILNDTLRVLDSALSKNTVNNLLLALKDLESENGKLVPCSDSSVAEDNCLTQDDLWYLMRLLSERENLGNFQQLYPKVDAMRYSSLLKEFKKFSDLSRLGNTSTIEETVRLHPLLLSLEKYLYSLTSQDNYEEMNLPLPQETNVAKASNLIELIHPGYKISDDTNYVKPKCSESPETMPYLTGIYTEPAFNLTPQFYPATMNYYVAVPYEVHLIKIWAFAKSCSCEARLDDKYGSSRPTNYTLGLGENYINILVIDITHSEPWVISTYTVYVTRLGHLRQSFSISQPHQVCGLKQSCELKYIPTESCGLQITQFESWQSLKKYTEVLPVCDSGQVSGQWLLPCASCADENSCDWDMAMWQPTTCRHQKLTSEQLKTCMVNKRILFIGDSTNRGMMHYIMERVNDTLTSWDKTHNIKLYTNLNDNRSAVSFAYYPQFWLSPDKRPSLEAALEQLMQRSQPLSNDHNTVVVLGGVQWLSSQHLNNVVATLYKHGLGKVKLIMKSLGSGFHQPVDGLRVLTPREQQLLLLRNHDLIEFAKNRKFRVIDTFNMTMARYKDFLQGKCACHFHKVSEVKDIDESADMHPVFGSLSQSGILTRAFQNGKLLANYNDERKEKPARYHVDGVINAIYSELVINEICRGYV